MAECKQCGTATSRWDLKGGICPICVVANREAQHAAERQAKYDKKSEEQSLAGKLSAITLTTETAHNLPVSQRLDIVTAEVVIGMNVFKDIAALGRDIFGGRSKAMQDGLREARKSALSELRREALALGADAVVGVDLDYSEISGSGKSMLLLVASGTAVKLGQS